jgi:hypothetical protein
MKFKYNVALRNSLVDDAPGYLSASIRSVLSSSSADLVQNDDAFASSGKQALSDNNKRIKYSIGAPVFKKVTVIRIYLNLNLLSEDEYPINRRLGRSV